MEFLSNSQIHEYLIKDIVSILNHEVDEYLLAEHNPFIMLIHVYYYEMMDFLNQILSDMHRQTIIHKFTNPIVSDIHYLYTYFREEFNNIFKELDTFQINLNIIAIRIIHDPQIQDKMNFLNNYTYKKLVEDLVDDTISEMVVKFRKWGHLVTVNLNLINIYSEKYKNDNGFFIENFLEKVNNLLNNKTKKNSVQNKRVRSDIYSTPISGNKSDFPLVTIEENSDSNTDVPVVAEAYIKQSNLLLPKHLLIRPNDKIRPTPVSGGKKSKKKQPRKKSKKNNTRKNQIYHPRSGFNSLTV